MTVYGKLAYIMYIHKMHLLYMYILTYAYTHIYMHTHIHIYVYIYTHILRICKYIYIYTNIYRETEYSTRNKLFWKSFRLYLYQLHICILCSLIFNFLKYGLNI